MKPNSRNTSPVSWSDSLRKFKETLAQRLWTIPDISESEKEMVFKELLSDLDQLETLLADLHGTVSSNEKRAKEEADLLRSLLGIPGDELKTRAFSLIQELNHTREKSDELQEEVDQTTAQLRDLENENHILREKIRSLESETESSRLDFLKNKEADIKRFSDENEQLKNQLLDLDARLRNLRELFKDTNSKLLSEKQEEISLLQKTLLDDMDKALRKKQSLLLAEEEMFTKGVAQKVRTGLISAQGQLLLTLERLGLMDPESKSESFWKARLKIFAEGAEDLGKSFKNVQIQLQDLTKSLDEFLHLTQKREFVFGPVSLPEIVKKEAAYLYVDRQPDLQIEIHADEYVSDVHGERDLVEFIIRTLVRNSYDALKEGQGKISILTRQDSEKKLVEVTVSDSGSGMNAERQKKIFQPFFTTKKNRQGLSLSRARRYAELMGGQLELVESGADGTTFQLRLPMHEEA